MASSSSGSHCSPSPAAGLKSPAATTPIHGRSRAGSAVERMAPLVDSPVGEAKDKGIGIGEAISPRLIKSSTLNPRHGKADQDKVTIGEMAKIIAGMELAAFKDAASRVGVDARQVRRVYNTLRSIGLVEEVCADMEGLSKAYEALLADHERLRLAYARSQEYWCVLTRQVTHLEAGIEVRDRAIAQLREELEAEKARADDNAKRALELEDMCKTVLKEHDDAVARAAKAELAKRKEEKKAKEHKDMAATLAKAIEAIHSRDEETRRARVDLRDAQSRAAAAVFDAADAGRDHAEEMARVRRRLRELRSIFDRSVAFADPVCIEGDE